MAFGEQFIPLMLEIQLTFCARAVYTQCMEHIALTADERQFFSLVSDAVFINPFSEQREDINRDIGGSISHVAPGEVTPEVMQEVSKRIEKLDEDSPTRIHDFEQPDRGLIEYVFLFDIYYKFAKLFDQFIVNQAAASTSITVSFAKDAISLLVKRGFTRQLANRYFSMFYQIRRAFHFIARGLIGESPSMRLFRMNLWNNIFTHDIRHYERSLWDKMEDFSTLLLGPTGCGKGAAAAAIGRSGFIPFDEKRQTFVGSFTEAFIPINLSQYPETLVESELFGHTKGAFTGAVAPHEGLFALCGPHGSIFLDEIGDISTEVQIKLLQILQERVFSPVGSHEKLRFHGRVIAATNKPKFRDDFYYRLCSDCIIVPSLQQRIQENPNELDELIAHSVKRITGNRSEELVKTVAEVIDKRLGRDYHWPGNVRELEQCIRRVIIKRDYQSDTVTAFQDLQTELLSEISAGTIDAQELLATYCTILYQRYATYEEVARKTKLDRRTVKKYIQRHLPEH
jgi:DNA-binding NtrC family response regulator